MLCLPVVLICAVPGLLLGLLIRLDSAGPVLYRQRRLGKDGKSFDVFKFRTMRQDADEVLARYLEENPGLREEWENDRKLKHDPRITRVDHFLRKSSLDELPQLLSGRNNTTYEERVSLDRYYVTNWCIWMDLWILARTFPVVLTGYGAY